MLFRLFLVGYIEKVVMSDNTGSNFNSTYHRYLSTDFDAVWCLATSAQCESTVGMGPLYANRYSIEKFSMGDNRVNPKG
jgi:hypothetical protein